jgi:hypothetical protein
MTLSQDALDAARDAYDDWYDGLVGSKDAAIAAAIEAYLKEAVAELDKPAPSLPRLRAFLKGGDATEKSDLEGHPSAHVAQAPASAAGASPTPPRAPAAMPDGSAEAVAEGERERCINQLRKMSDRLDQTHTGPRGTLAAAIEALIAPRAPAAETAEREAERRYRYTTVDTWPERHAVTRERSAFVAGWQATRAVRPLGSRAMTAPTPLSPEEIEALQKRLRERGEAWRAFAPDGPNGRDFLAAADALTNLSRQLAEANARAEDIWTDLCHSDQKRDEARADLERVTRERDAANQAIQQIGMSLGSTDEWTDQAAMIWDVTERAEAIASSEGSLPAPTLPEETGDA